MGFGKSGKPGAAKQTPQRPSAIGKGIDLLSLREQSARERKGKLARSGYDKDESEAALEQLQRSSYQSDERFAEVLARSRAAQGYGPRRIAAELKSHGIADASIRSACDAVDVDWEVSAERQYRRRYGGGMARDRAELAKRVAFLLRRGFDAATVREVTRAPADDSDAGFD